MEEKNIHYEVISDGRTRYFDDNYHTLGYSKPDQNGRIIFYDEYGIATGNYAEATSSNETMVFDRNHTLLAIRQTYGSESIFYDANRIETGRSRTFVEGITHYTPTTRRGSGGISSDQHIQNPDPSELYPGYWDSHIMIHRAVRFRHVNPFQWAALVLFAVSLFCNGIAPALLLYVIIGVLIYVAVHMLDSMGFDSAENYHPLSITARFELVTLIGLAAAVYLRPALNSFLYQNHYNNRLSVMVLALTIVPVAASAIYKIMDRKRKK